ncbi:Ig-like domain-containing protein [Solwaraspora sp. WMMD791]|uniref:Ig-like domain-containing protein n=1 Tax=Solwaraspora sp. WMMD791 TaxID=3016086 RepID=UPI00249A6350|nr:Ig-like domain-containing protein [Solwaraspora sp. WMMD791]WFE27719.1 Ig-like domain-containing protein [Solwaraspora sp. WMMD791]
MRRIIAALVAVLLTVTGTVLGFALRPAHAAPACTVDYQLTREWSSGFVADLTLTNLGAPLSSWVLQFRLAYGQQADYELSVLPPGVRMNTVFGPVVLSAPDGPELPTGGTVRIQLGGHYQGDNPAPSEFLFNELRCNAADPTASPPRPSPEPSYLHPPTVAVTSPLPNEVFPAPASIPVTAAVTPAPGRQITKVEFHANGTLLHTDVTAPYGFIWRGAAATEVLRITATAQDDTGSRGSATVRGLRVIDPVPAGAAPPLVVSGNRLVTLDRAARPYQLRGVVRAGAHARCVAGTGIWDGPADDASVRAIRNWRANAVRILVDRTCWLGTAAEPSPYQGSAYRAAIVDYVQRLARHGVTPIIALHGASTGDAKDFWGSVARHLGTDRSVLFDLRSTGYPPADDADPATAWRCWRDATDCGTGVPYPGMQELVRTVRVYGAFNTLLVGGLDESNDLRGWLAYRPDDPAGRNLAAAWRVDDDAACATPTCWQQQVAPVAAEVPVVAVEVSEDTGGHRFVGTAIDWLDERRIGFLASVWHTGGYPGVPPLIRDYDGRPTPYGVGVKDRLRR